MQTNYELRNSQAAEAAQWMNDELRRNQGTLSQEQAWKGVRERFGTHFAKNDEGGFCLCKRLLIEFRRLSPNVIWDPEHRLWRQQRRGDVITGPRMLNGKMP